MVKVWVLSMVSALVLGCQSPSDCAASCCDETSVVSQRSSEALCINYALGCQDDGDPASEKSCVARMADYYRSNCMLSCVK